MTPNEFKLKAEENKQKYLKQKLAYEEDYKNIVEGFYNSYINEIDTKISEEFLMPFNIKSINFYDPDLYLLINKIKKHYISIGWNLLVHEFDLGINHRIVTFAFNDKKFSLWQKIKFYLTGNI